MSAHSAPLFNETYPCDILSKKETKRTTPIFRPVTFLVAMCSEPCSLRTSSDPVGEARVITITMTCGSRARVTLMMQCANCGANAYTSHLYL